MCVGRTDNQKYMYRYDLAYWEKKLHPVEHIISPMMCVGRTDHQKYMYRYDLAYWEKKLHLKISVCLTD